MSRVAKSNKPTTMDAVLARIKETYRQMTPTYQAVAQYVLDHHQELAFASVARIGELTGISPATVVRFSDHLGLSGYSELQTLAQQSLRRGMDTVSQLQRTARRSDPHSLLALALRSDISNLERTLDSVSDQSFIHALELLASARTIHLIGLRSTFGLVRHFEFYLGWIGRDANVLRPGIGDLPEQILKVGSNDACVALSFRRYTRDTVEILRAVRKIGAKAVALTDSELSPIAEESDVTLPISVHFPAFYESRVAVLSVMNALVFGIALADRKRTLASLRRHEEAWSANDTYVNENFRFRLSEEIRAFAATDPRTMLTLRGRIKRHGKRQPLASNPKQRTGLR